MKSFLISLLLIASPSYAAEFCGIVRIKANSIILEDHQSEPSVVRYKIENADRAQWMKGSCTCLEGYLVERTEGSKRWDYNLFVTQLTSVDESGQDCRPVFFP